MLNVKCKDCGSNMIGNVIDMDTTEWRCPTCGHVCNVDVEDE